MSFSARRVVLASMLAAALAAGCSDRGDNRRKIRKIEGVAKKIDLKTNKVSMSFRDKKGEDRVLEGTVKEDTEVWINGRSQRLDDVRVGDKAVVYGYREGEGIDQQLVATRIEITRPEEINWKSGEAPAAGAMKPATTQPADG